MTCEEFVELVTAYLEGALPGPEQRAFEEHVSLCAGCERYLDQLRQTISLLGAIPEEALSGPAVQRLLHAFVDWRGQPGPAVP
jgi:anti-sigma factor RsiW